MKIRSQSFEAQCWRKAKKYWDALDESHVYRLIERSVELSNQRKQIKKK